MREHIYSIFNSHFLTYDEKTVLIFLTCHPNIKTLTQKSVTETLHTSHERISRAINGLNKKGFIRTQREKRFGGNMIWELVEKEGVK